MHVDPVALRTSIRAHPWQAVAAAFAVGVYLGLSDRDRPVVRGLRGAAGTFGLDLLREAASRHARSWLATKLGVHVVEVA